LTAQPGGKEQILASVLRTFEVAELLAREGEMGVTRIAREIGLDKSSVYRILATLKSIGYGCRNPATQGYSNTNRFSSLCGGFLQAENLRERAHPALADLADKAGEAASLARSEMIPHTRKRDLTMTFLLTLTPTLSPRGRGRKPNRPRTAASRA